MENQSPCYPVSVVGSGTGDPELLTVKAMKIFGTADVLLYDCREAEPAPIRSKSAPNIKEPVTYLIGQHVVVRTVPSDVQSCLAISASVE